MFKTKQYYINKFYECVQASVMTICFGLFTIAMIALA